MRPLAAIALLSIGCQTMLADEKAGIAQRLTARLEADRTEAAISATLQEPPSWCLDEPGPTRLCVWEIDADRSLKVGSDLKLGVRLWMQIRVPCHLPDDPAEPRAAGSCVVNVEMG